MSFKTYFPKHEENRMKNEGDVLTARNNFVSMFIEQSRAEQSRAEQSRAEQSRTLFYITCFGSGLTG